MQSHIVFSPLFHNTIRCFGVLALISASLAFSVEALAQPALNDSEAPSLEVHTDQASPWPRFGLSVDLLRPWLGDYRLTLHAMPSRFIGARIEGGFRNEAEIAFVGKVGADFRPMGRSFDGVLLTVGAEYRQGTSKREQEFIVLAEGGYSIMWKGLYVSAAVGVGANVLGQGGIRVTGHLSAGWVF